MYTHSTTCAKLDFSYSTCESSTLQLFHNNTGTLLDRFSHHFVIIMQHTARHASQYYNTVVSSNYVCIYTHICDTLEIIATTSFRSPHTPALAGRNAAWCYKECWAPSAQYALVVWCKSSQVVCRWMYVCTQDDLLPDWKRGEITFHRGSPALRHCHSSFFAK